MQKLDNRQYNGEAVEIFYADFIKEKNDFHKQFSSTPKHLVNLTHKLVNDKFILMNRAVECIIDVLKYAVKNPECNSEQLIKGLSHFYPISVPGYSFNSSEEKYQQLLHNLSSIKTSQFKNDEVLTKAVFRLFDNDRVFADHAKKLMNEGCGYTLYKFFDILLDELEPNIKNWSRQASDLFTAFKNSKNTHTDVPSILNFLTKDNDNFLFLSLRKHNKEEVEQMLKLGSSILLKNQYKQDALTLNLKSKDAVREAKTSAYLSWIEKICLITHIQEEAKTLKISPKNRKIKTL